MSERHDLDERSHCLAGCRACAIGDLRAQLATATARVQALEAALEQSVMFQSHYAVLLNGWDGGQRMSFQSAQSWLDRLASLAPDAGRTGA